MSLTVIVDIDIDSMDPVEAKKWLPFKPQDQTSNQRLVYEQMICRENREIFLQVVREYKDQAWEAILDRMVRPWESSRSDCTLTNTVPEERVTLRRKYREHQRSSSPTVIASRSLRHRQSYRSRSQLCSRIREGRHIERPFLHKSSMHRPWLERMSHPSERRHSHSRHRLVLCSPSHRCQSGGMSIHQSLLQS